jgi:hypothetical protein
MALKKARGFHPLDPHRRAAGVLNYDPGGTPAGVEGAKPPPFLALTLVDEGAAFQVLQQLA